MSSKPPLNIMGVNVHSLGQSEIIKRVEHLAGGKDFSYIVTPNPEIVLAARHDEELFYILNQADLAVPDGFGLVLAGLAMGRLVRRFTGADLAERILSVGQEKAWRVLVVCWRQGLSRPDDISESLHRRWPELEVKVVETDRFGETFRAADIEKFKPRVVLVALGSPWQEKFIYNILPEIPGIKLSAGVGGALDFLSGAVNRAPKILRRLGLEWLWRLANQPKRWRRIFNAVAVFPWRFLLWRFVHPLRYRPNIACLLYRRSGQGIEVILVERSDESGHWQIPQGGLDGQAPRKAGFRELHEELNTDKFKIKKIYTNLYKYRFGTRRQESWRTALKGRKYTGYKGQVQSLCIAEFTGQDKEIQVNYWDHQNWKWTPLDQVLDQVHLVRREAMAIYLDRLKEHLGVEK